MDTIPQKTITLSALFEGHERVLRLAIAEAITGASASDVAQKHIEPILSDLEANAGQEMDPVFIAYTIQYAIL